MDSRAKQRITGAVILVAVFVLLVPELLTGPGKDAAQPATTAPDETGLRQYTIDLDASAKPAQPATAPDAAVTLPTPSAADASPMATPGESAAPESPPASSPAPAPTPDAPVQDPVPATAVAAMAPTPATSVPTTSAAANAPKPVDKPPATKPSATTGGGFAVQLGSFSVRDNADRLAREMTAKGFAASVAPTKTNGRDLYRVLVGPTRDRAAAEALAAQLRRIGQTGSIVSIS